MPLSRIFKRASNFILRSQHDESSTPAYSDGEIVFCKNNVCVHPPTLVRQETDIFHHPGYLTVTCQINGDKRTLFLSWIPNTTLRRHPATIEQRSLSVTRTREISSSREGEVRRRSASTIVPPGVQAGRRYSSGSYETECSGCFPDNGNRFLSDRQDVHSSKGSISSCSDNNSLTPTDELTKSNLVDLKSKLTGHVCKSLITSTQSTSDEAKTKDCDRNIAKDTNSSENNSHHDTVQSLSSNGAYRKMVVGSSVALDNAKTESTSDENNTTVPKEKQNQSSSESIKFGSNSNSSSENNKIIDHFNSEAVVQVPNEDISSKIFRNNINNNVTNNIKNATIIEPENENLNSQKEVDNSSLNGNAKKDSTAQFSFVRPEGIVYIDSLVLQENPHLLIHDDPKDDKNRGRTKESVGKMKTNSDNLEVKGLRRRLSVQSNDENLAPSWMSSPELLALKHNLTFPESVTASPVVRRTQRCCRKFCVDLSEMRSLRLFFSDPESTRGQLVVASRECQYKILHFHHGGLERLATVLQQWHLLSATIPSDNLPYRHFMVCRPAMDDSELHPEEGRVGKITESDWLEMLNQLGQVEDDLALRKGIFLGGLEPSLRKTVWPFLLHCYSYQSTTAERDHITAIRRQEYAQITSRRLSLEGAAKDKFMRNIQCVVEKDVIRTDRGNPYYAGESNPHVETMKNILLNYAIYDAGSGYMQGMSDLVAPVLVEIGNEADAFWCFVGLMSRAIFVCTPTDSDMERNLAYLRELIREMVPAFYAHLERHTDAMELLFCHRWILLCFKREFPEEVALKMWEACWANYLTDYFNLFLCLAIVSAYADDVIAQDLRTDEMLLHFSSLALFMDGDLILRKARGLLYQFRQRTVIPCSLAGLCQECGPGMWDSGHAPTVVCRGTNCPQQPCPYRGISNSGD